MKKAFTLIILLAGMAVQAQSMTFEQTVKYLNEKLANFSEGVSEGQPKPTLTAQKNGVITLSYFKNSINLFDLCATCPHYGNDSSISYEQGIEVVWVGYYQSTGGYCQITASYSKEHQESVARITHKIEAERFVKALLHLKSLCTPEKDPFDK